MQVFDQRQLSGILFLLITSLFMSSCSSMGLFGKSYRLEYKGDSSIHYMRHYSKSITQQVKNRNFATEQESELSLTEKREFLPDQSAPNRLVFQMEVTDKQGDGNLEDFAFPPLGQPLIIHYSPRAKVLHVEGYPEDSIFYVPPIPLPARSVRVGSTWSMRAKWKTQGTGFPFVMDAIAIFKGVESCGESQCANLEISGKTFIEQSGSSNSDFANEITGRVLFDIDKGRIYSSDMKSYDQLNLYDVLVRSVSCFASKTLPAGKDLTCEPPEFEDL